ncbi:uncharacterized protein LOC120679641 isoform X2 [Panicum virgatum]|uniref:uncharacterized protein LOC120679641 isoform X2 n=1 Tax=Panicum virgatum TaxID=38727 RepID=UPI0019D5F12B|nr:uncharacterized protein LOC120679641 isoform X2 [Panicum virgatum]
MFCCLLLYLSWLWDLFLISEEHLQARTLHESTTEVMCAQREKAIEDTKLMLEKELNQLKTNMEKRFIDQERSFDKAVLELRYDLKKDADQQNLKHYVDLLKVKLEIKANDFKMEEMLKSQGHKFDLKIRDHDIRTLKGLGWFFGFSTVFLCRSLLFGSDSKKTSSSE